MQSTVGLATLFANLARGLEGNRWCVIGAQAAILYGSTRMTLDVDISASIAEAERGLLLRRLRASGFSPRIEDALEFAQRTRVVLLIHPITGVPVDLVLAGPGIEEELLDRAHVLDIGGTRVPVLSPEDLIASKLLADASTT